MPQESNSGLYSPLIFIGVIIVLYLFYESQTQSTEGNTDGTPLCCQGCSMYLTAPQIGTYASNAGFSGDDLTTAIAICFAESSGRPNVVGDLSLGRSIGLWQINLAAHPEYSEEELKDPQTNANAAFAIYQAAGNDFKPWSTFKSGAYTAYLNTATVGAQNA
jgi:hypothetical protein